MSFKLSWISPAVSGLIIHLVTRMGDGDGNGKKENLKARKRKLRRERGFFGGRWMLLQGEMSKQSDRMIKNRRLLRVIISLEIKLWPATATSFS